MKNTTSTHACVNWYKKFSLLPFFLILSIFLVPVPKIIAQCNSNTLVKITNSSGSATYPGTNGSPDVTVTTTSTGEASIISFCGITNGFRAGAGDRSGSFKFSFSPAVNGIAINLNALSNTPGDREIVRIRINDVLYTVTPSNIVCAADCFGCSGVPISSSGGAVSSVVSPTGNGVGQLLVQNAGPINSIEYVNEVQANDPEGSVFEIFFNNSNCILPITLSAFTASASAAGIQLTWVASTQIDQSHFEIERSTDGLNFMTVGGVPVNSSARYQYNDATAITETTYYRLKMVDRDGKFTYSTTIRVTSASRSNKKIYFDAANDVLTVAGLIGQSSITVYTVNGQQFTKLQTTKSTERITTAGWPMGLYIVKVVNNGRVLLTEKIIKQ